jgi:hypothetical protein
MAERNRPRLFHSFRRCPSSFIIIIRQDIRKGNESAEAAAAHDRAL